MLTIGEFARLGQISARMLRHYDEIGLLRPDRVDDTNGYRLYTTSQLGTLHRILALRDLGFTLEQIGELLDENPPVEQLRGMLRIRRAQIEQSLGDEQARLRRVEAHLRALEGTHTVNMQDIVIKKTQPVRIAESTATGITHDAIGPSFARLLPQVFDHLNGVGAAHGICVCYYEYEGVAEDGTIALHAGLDIGDQNVPDGPKVRVIELPVVEAASAVYRGPMDGLPAAWETLVKWVDDSGYRLVGDSRELYHEHDDDDPTNNVTELQVAVSR